MVQHEMVIEGDRMLERMTTKNIVIYSGALVRPTGSSDKGGSRTDRNGPTERYQTVHTDRLTRPLGGSRWRMVV